MKKIYNFYAGPAILPEEVLLQAQRELLNFQESGLSILEISHRSRDFEQVIAEGEQNILELLGLGNDYQVLFLQGGANLQFTQVPMNFLPQGKTADYILTGAWAEKALKEAEKIGNTHVSFSDKENNYRRVPQKAEIHLSENPAYIHLTSNNTIYGTAFETLPQWNVPLVADMSSDIFAKPIDASKFSLIYAGAQKNAGAAGVTIVIIKKTFLATAEPTPGTMLSYKTQAEKNSLYNTPPCFNIYLLNLVTRWLKRQGGLKAMAVKNAAKAKLIYDVIDGSNGYYRGHAAVDSRSLMNITFTMAHKELEEKFAMESEAAGLIGLKGHRSVGGLRASLYNAMSLEGAAALAEFMQTFQQQN